MSSLERFILDPRYHDLLAILKGARNGFVYGVKIRFPHALVMTFLFSSRPLRQKITAIIRATLSHARNLATFATIYKVVLVGLRRGRGLVDAGQGDGTGKGRVKGRERSLDTFIAGLIGGWWVFGERNAINEQIVLYVSSRVIASLLPRLIFRSPNAPAPLSPSSSSPSSLLSYLPPSLRPSSLAPLLSKESNPRPIPPSDRAFTLYAAMCWGLVMYVYRHSGERLQPGMVNSMKYIYRDSERWTNLKTLLWHNT